MTNTVTYTTTEISLAKLVPCPANARRTGTGLGIEALAASIQAHGLLQSLVVRPALDGQGQATGKYEVAAGGRRLAALKLLAKRKRIGKLAAIPCRVLDGDGVDGAEASLAENVVRVDMHPADQFEAFARLHQDGAGLGIEDIAARFGVSAHTVRQRLRLAVVSPALAREDVWTPADVAVAGAVLTLALDGSLRVERGLVRPEDEPKPEPATPTADADGQDGAAAGGTGNTGEGSDSGDAPAGGTGSSTSTGGAWPLPVRGGAGAVAEAEREAPALSGALQAELEAHRTAGLQAALAGQPGLALRIMLHALATDAFYARYADTVARFTSYPPNLAAACPGIADSPARQAMLDAEADWRGRLPEREADLWTWLGEQDTSTLLGLLAVCVARTADAGRADWTTPHGVGCIQARVATAAGLDMRQNWTATREGYLDRVPKALILDAVREGAGGSAAARIAGTKKEVMAADAEALLGGTGWLPAVLHVPGVTYPVDSGVAGDRDAAPVPMAAE